MSCSRCQNLEDRLKSIVNRSINELHDQLYPKGLGKRAEADTPEVRLVILSRFSGRAELLEELGANIKGLEDKINEETEKVSTIQY